MKFEKKLKMLSKKSLTVNLYTVENIENLKQILSNGKININFNNNKIHEKGFKFIC